MRLSWLIRSFCSLRISGCDSGCESGHGDLPASGRHSELRTTDYELRVRGRMVHARSPQQFANDAEDLDSSLDCGGMVVLYMSQHVNRIFFSQKKKEKRDFTVIRILFLKE